MGLESLKPEMPSLEIHGLKLYGDMITEERKAILDIPNSVAWYFKEHVDINYKKPIKLIDHMVDEINESTRGKILVIVESGFNYKSLIDNLYHSRQEFSNHLQIIADIQQIKAKNIGVRSTAAPELIDIIADEISYSHNNAYRSSRLTLEEIADLVDMKLSGLEESIKTSKNSRQYSRIEKYETRIDQLNNDYKKLLKIAEKTTIIGRIRSGDALKLRAKNNDDSIQFGIKNISIIYSKEPNEAILRPSNTHNRTRNHGRCLLKIEELRLEIYAAPTVH